MEAHPHQPGAGVYRRRTTFPQLPDGSGDGRRRSRANLDLGEEGLVVDAIGGQAGMRQDLVGDMRQLEGLCIDEEELLLQSDREGIGLAEAIVYGVSPSAARAAIRPKTRAAARPLA
jgi:hypothetical protein